MDDVLPGLNIDTVDGVVVAVGEIDANNADQFEAGIASLPDGAPLVVDLAGVSFIGSSGLRVLVDAHQRALSANSVLTIRNPSPAVTRLLEISGMTEHLRVETT